jgi:hypothetical protein
MKFSKGPRIEPGAYSHPVKQLHYLSHEGTPYIVILRENSLIEIVRNFTDTVLAESRVSVDKILPCFGTAIQFLRQDGNIEFS